MDDFKRMIADPVSRRGFMARMGAAGLGVAALSLLDGGGVGLVRKSYAAGKKAPAGSSDFPGIPGRNINEVVLNYALTLEILEADLYRQALNQASGLPLNTPLFDDPLSYELAVGTGGLTTDTARDGFDYLLEFAYVEAAHRDYLMTVLGSIKAPTATANANGYAFPGGPGGDVRTILSNILPLEETGVRAYLGALPYLKNGTYVTAAATIYSTEARHSAAIAYLIGRDPGPVKMTGDQQVVSTYPSENTFEYFLPPATVLSAASAYFVS